MKIKELSTLANGAQAKIVGVLIKNNMMPKNGGGEYLQVGFKDASGVIEFPLFERCDIIHAKLEDGKIYQVTGTVNIWNGNVQLKSVMFLPLETDVALENLGREHFLHSYSKEAIDAACTYISDIINRMDEGYRTVLYYLTGLDKSGNYSRFITCPSAEKHHGAKIGGLVIHTAGVLQNVDNMINNYIIGVANDFKTDEPVINVDRTLFKAIVHDIAKMREYEYNTVIRRKPNVVGHLIDGCADLEQAVKHSRSKTSKELISDEDIENIKYSILSHHGQYGPYQPKTLEDEIIHLADMIDARFIGEIEKK